VTEFKSLAKETAVYGVSSILGKFLNWCLVPLYTHVLASPADYGIVTNLYAYTALILVILTYGMETGLFRFMNKGTDNPQTVYSTTLISLFVTSAIFVVSCFVFSDPISNAMGYALNPEYIMMLAIVVAMDAFGSIPFAYLRYKKRPYVFAGLKLLMIFVNILMNIFFLIGCPYIMTVAPSLIDWFYRPEYGVGYVFVANLISTTTVTIALLPYVFVGKFKFDIKLLKRMLAYSLPLLLLGIVGIANQTIDKILFPYLFEDKMYAQTQLGIYGACFKIAMVMMMFTQAFRYAYEPFVFAKNKNADSRQAYADIMKYYFITSLLIFLGMMFYIDILKLIIGESYWEGLKVVPIVLLSYIFQGVYFNLSMWYKLTDKTMFGAYMSFIGSVITITLIWVLVPRIGYIGAAYASLCAYLCMMLISYFLGQKYMPVNYDLVGMLKYFVLAMALYGVSILAKNGYPWLNYLINTLLLALFVVYMVKKDLDLHTLPIIGKYFKKH
jgi:O-antigen/teichoic acid export membrane protein